MIIAAMPYPLIEATDLLPHLNQLESGLKIDPFTHPAIKHHIAA
jgi:hypothetical protein